MSKKLKRADLMYQSFIERLIKSIADSYGVELDLSDDPTKPSLRLKFTREELSLEIQARGDIRFLCTENGVTKEAIMRDRTENG